MNAFTMVKWQLYTMKYKSCTIGCFGDQLHKHYGILLLLLLLLLLCFTVTENTW